MQAMKDTSIINKLIFPSPGGEHRTRPASLAGFLAWAPRDVAGYAAVAAAESDADGATAVGVGNHAKTVPCLVVPCRTGPARCVALYAHGNGDDIGLMADQVAGLADELGVHLIAPEYPGYGPTCRRGGSQSSSESGVDAALEAAYHLAVTGLGFAPSSVLIIGRSIGSGTAARLAASLAATTSPGAGPAGGLLLVHPYTTLKDEIRSVAGGVAAALVGERWQPKRDVAVLTAATPVFVAHGDADELIPHTFGREVAAAADEAGVPSEFVSVAGRGHNNIHFPSQVGRPAARFFRELLTGDHDDRPVRAMRVPPALMWPRSPERGADPAPDEAHDKAVAEASPAGADAGREPARGSILSVLSGAVAVSGGLLAASGEALGTASGKAIDAMKK